MPNYTDKDNYNTEFYWVRNKNTGQYKTGTHMHSVPKLYTLGTAKAHLKQDEEIVPLTILEGFPLK